MKSDVEDQYHNKNDIPRLSIIILLSSDTTKVSPYNMRPRSFDWDGLGLDYHLNHHLLEMDLPLISGIFRCTMGGYVFAVHTLKLESPPHPCKPKTFLAPNGSI